MKIYKIFIVVLNDRHIDPVISVHSSWEGALTRVEEHKAEYDDGMDYQWSEQPVADWLLALRTDSDDGPKIHVEAGELES